MDIKLTRWQRVKLGLSLAFRGVKQVDGAEGVFGILDLGSRSGRYKGKLQAYKDSPILKAPVWRIAKDIAAVDWKLVTFRGGEKVEVPDHPFINLLMKPTPLRFLTEFHLRYLTQAYLELCGDAYWLIERNRAGVPAELWVIPPTWVVGLPTPSLPSFEVQMAHARIRVDERDVVWFKDPDLLNPYGRGLGGAEPLDDEIATDEMASKWNRHFFGNNARPDVLVSIPGTTKEQIDRVREAWVAEHSGWKNAGKPRFINYEAKFEILTQNQKDMDFVNSRQHSKRTVRETYGVPPEILGDVSNSNRATIEAAELIYTKFVLKPRLMLLTDALNTFLKTEFDEGLFLEFENIVSEDREQKLQVANEGISRAAITVNEWRDSMGWDPRPDGDKLLLPFSVIPTATLNQSDEASPNQSQALGMRPSDPLRSRGLRTVLKKKPRNKLAESEIFSILLDPQTEIDRLIELTLPYYRDAARRGVRLLELGVDFDVEDPNVVEFLRATARERLSGVVGRKWRRLEDTLREGISLGESIEEIAGRITHQFDLSIAGARATARTEVINASNGGRLLGMSKSGVDQKEWLSARDGDVRGSRPGDRFDHAGADGITVDLDRPFIVSGESLMFPGDTSRGASAGNVVNCFIDPDTEILVHNGTKRIADVAEGDSVLTHQKRFKQVLRILSERFYDGEIFTVLTASGKIEVTPEHPVMTPGGWKRANELGYDDRVYTVAVFRRSSAIAIGGSFDDITDIGRRTVRDMRLYNFAVEEDESYIANNLVTHNCRCTISPVLRTQNESLALSMQNSLMRTIRWKQFVSEMSPVERAYAARLRAYFKSQREMTLRALGRLA